MHFQHTNMETNLASDILFSFYVSVFVALKVSQFYLSEILLCLKFKKI